MEDGLILNLADDSPLTGTKSSQGKKGGRWTDRLKAKRGQKRKAIPDEGHAAPSTKTGLERRPSKRARQDPLNTRNEDGASGPVVSSTRGSTQIISSLFTSNPTLEQPMAPSQPQISAKPSNAPLRDSSTFIGLGLDPLITTHLETKMNIEKPTSIQRAALPIMLSSSSEDTSSRDVFIQSQTGSGKTLSFLLPIIQDLLPLSSLSYIDRSIGTLAIIIAPTRELAKQISDVLEALLKLRLRPTDESAEDADTSAPRLTRWLVSGLLSGGATRTHEKARLRKGVPILVSTPGRLLDHLQNTSSFNVGKCRWLVLDEADRLMDLGFEESINGIVKGLDGRKKLAMQAVEEGNSMEVGGWDWSRNRRTVLCSATIREDVQKLAGNALMDPIVIKALQENSKVDAVTGEALGETVDNNNKFTPPSQLSQKYVVVPLKLRLVTLIALLRSLLSQSQGRRGTKIIVFLSCTDSVDFHWNLLGGTSMGGNDEETAEGSSDSDGGNPDDDDDDDDDDEETKTKTKKSKVNGPEKVELKSDLLPETSIYRLHGSLPLQTRLASLRGFASSPSDKSKPSQPPPSTSSILLCTSVASRGLDLPLVKAVIQYDLPTEGGANEYVHRVGRTARVGKGGEAWSFVAPSESAWVKWVVEKMEGDVKEVGSKGVNLEAVGMDTVLKKGFGGKGAEYESRATDVQLSFERWVLKDQHYASLARKAFSSHIRAYATHPSDEKHLFHVRNLHLGHLAKAFALREAPSAVSTNKGNGKGAKGKASGSARKPSKKHSKALDSDDEVDVGEAEKRMEKAVREQGRLTRKGGKMVSSGHSEFQITGGYNLESLMNGSRT